MKYELIKGAVGTQWWVRRRELGNTKWEYLKSFDDEVKAAAYMERMIRGEAIGTED